MEFDTLSFDIDGVSTVVKAIGKGPPVIALHGAATPRGSSMGTGPGRSVSGISAVPPWLWRKRSGPSRQGYADLIIHYLHLLPALKVDRPHLVGHSMGGWMAAEIAAVAASASTAWCSTRRSASITLIIPWQIW